MRKGLILGVIASAVLSVALSACGGSDDKTESTTDSPQATTAAVATTAAAQAAAAPAPAPAPAAAVPQAFEVKGGDFFFEPKDLTARPGPITITFANQAERRDHTFVVKTKDGSGDLVKSPEVKAGDSAKFEFTLSEEGTYEVYCNLPGHASRGQVGTLTVRRS